MKPIRVLYSVFDTKTDDITCHPFIKSDDVEAKIKGA